MPYHSLMMDFLLKYDQIWSQRQGVVNRVIEPHQCSFITSTLTPGAFLCPIKWEKVACGSLREAPDQVMLTFSCHLYEGRSTGLACGADSEQMKTFPQSSCLLL